MIGLLLFAANAFAFEVVAHRGVHQEYGRKGLTNETCTATRIEPPTHDFLENTLPSIRRSFELGADMVEVDIKATHEGDAPSQMVLFHDWTLECRTNGRGVTHEQSLAELRELDIGFGYTADGGKTFPFRGKNYGPMPTLQEALGLLQQFPDRKLLFNVKDKFADTHETFLRITAAYPENVRERLYIDQPRDFAERYRAAKIGEAIYQGGGPAKECFGMYVLLGWTGYFPEACRNTRLFVPIHETMGRLHPWLDRLRYVRLLWGWPRRFLERAHAHNTDVFASQVDTEADWEALKHEALDGVMTNRIERLGPLFQAKRKK